MLDFVIFAVASWRLAYMLVEEVGPFHIFVRIRKFVGISEVTAITPSGPQIGHVARNTIAEGMMCVWCVSVWCAFALLVGSAIPYIGPVVIFGARLLAISGVAIVIHEFVGFLQSGRGS